jgi:putative ABC transport system permease protein
MTRPSTPPPLAERVLAAAVPDAQWRESILGDLREEFSALHARHGSMAARKWYWRQALTIGGRAVAARARGTSMRRESWTASVDVPDSAGWTAGLSRDVKYAWRSLLRRPGTTSVIVLTLGLALAANATTFSLVDALVLRPFRFPGVERIAFLATGDPQDRYIDKDSVAPADFLEWRRELQTVEHVSAAEWWDANLSGIEEPEQVAGFKVTPGFFEAIDVPMTLGRTFDPSEEVLGAHRRAILGDRLWRRRFAADASIVGRTVRLDGEPYEVIGIAPPGFSIPLGAEVWAPLAFDAATAAERRRGGLSVIGRIKDGHNLAAARAEVEGVVARQREAYPATNTARPITVTDFTTGFNDPGAGPFLMVWQAAAILLLLIACANVANLLLARGTERAHEFALRLALGAGRARLARQLLIEGALLSVAGFILALPLAAAGLGLARGAVPASLIRFVPGWRYLTLSPEVLLLTGLVAIAATLVFSLAPALYGGRAGVADTLRQGARNMTGAPQRQWMRNTLATAQVALTLALLFASGLVLSAANQAINGTLGFDKRNVLAARLVLPERPYATPESRRQFFDRVTGHLMRIPAVTSVGIISHIPYGGSSASTELWPEGVPLQQSEVRSVDYRRISPEYFEALRIPLLAGRTFNSGDRDSTQAVAIVSRRLAERYWPQGVPLGRRVKLSATGPWITVVGIVDDVMRDWFLQQKSPTVYRPINQDAPRALAFVVRTVGDPMSIATDMRRAVAVADRDQPILELKAMETLVSDKAGGISFVANALGIMAIIAFVLAVTGLYSLMAYVAGRRTQEIGVRLALGARPWQVIRLTTRQAVGITAVGTVAGAALSTGLGKLMESMLAGTVSSSLLQLAGLSALLFAVALLAAYLPARRAASIDPTTALRAD